MVFHKLKKHTYSIISNNIHRELYANISSESPEHKLKVLSWHLQPHKIEAGNFHTPSIIANESFSCTVFRQLIRIILVRLPVWMYTLAFRKEKNT